MDVDRLKDADKVLLVSGGTLPFTLAWAARLFVVTGDPSASPYVSRAHLPAVLAFVIAQSIGHFVLCALALVVRRRTERRAPWLVHAEVQFWFACQSVALYLVGPFTSSLGVIFVALPVIGYLVFEARPITLGLVTGSVGTSLAIALPLLGLVPYAPFVGEPPFGHGRLEPAWALSIGLPSIFASVLVLWVFTTLVRRLRERQVELERLSSVDSLTGLANRRIFFERLREEVARAERYDEPLSLLMLDVDHFKSVNDTHGHLAGDAVLRVLGARLHETLRTLDVAARYGGEELAILLPHTPLEGARTVADRLLVLARDLTVTGRRGEPVAITISIGATTHRAKETPESLLARADAALYESKRAGRNRLTAVEMP